MKSNLLKSVAVGGLIAAAARFSESLATYLRPSNHTMHDFVGATVTFLTSSVLFFLWRLNHHAKLRMLTERERVRAHVHHHIRNAVMTILMKHPHDDIVREQSERIVRELESVLPSRNPDSMT